MTRRALGVALLLAALALTGAGAWVLHDSRHVQLLGEMIPRVETRQPVVALTFDDGPTPGYTAEVLRVLREHDARGTFFVVGEAVERWPSEARRIVAEGHELGNHTYTHARMVFRSPAAVRREVERTDSLIRALGYGGSIHFRPPYGKRLLLLPWYLSRTNRRTILWDVEPDSYPDVAASPERIVAHVLERVRPGSIVLLHVFFPSRSTSLEALPILIDSLRARGYRLVTVSQLLAARGR